MTLAAYVDGRLDERQASEVELHVATCCVCLDAVLGCREMAAAIIPPPALLKHCKAVVARSVRSARDRYGERGVFRTARRAVACAGFAIMAAFMGTRAGDTVRAAQAAEARVFATEASFGLNGTDESTPLGADPVLNLLTNRGEQP
jgi:anti-sigma factor RsiW